MTEPNAEAERVAIEVASRSVRVSKVYSLKYVV